MASSDLSKGQITLKLLLEVGTNMQREDEKEARIARPNCPRTRSMKSSFKSSFKAMVHNGNIVTYTDGKKDKVVYDNEYFQDYYPLYYKACVKFTVEYRADMMGCLSAILQDPIKKNSEKRYGVYRRLAYWAGFSGRQQFPQYMENAIREVHPDKTYKGFQAA
jgi:hypothetical protein